MVIGADAAGMSAAHQALRTAGSRGVDIEVVVLERTRDTSYSACGIPYLVAGLVDSTDDLTARSAEQHRAMGVDLRMGTTAVGIDLDRRSVTIDSVETGGGTLGFDQLVLATGAEPVVPPWAVDADGSPVPGVRAVKTLDDARYWLDTVVGHRGATRRAVVVGGGYVGLEMAEAALGRGYQTTLITRTRLMSNLDPEMSERIEQGVRDAGVTLVTGSVVESLEIGAADVKTLHTHDGQEFDADLVMLGIGVTPSVRLGVQAGLPVGEYGGYRTDDHQRLADGVWAAGDCCEVYDRVRGANAFLPLGTHANKQGRVCGYNVAGVPRRFAGALGTAITRFQSGATYLEISRTGLSTRQAVDAGFRPMSLVTDSSTASGYMPESAPIAIDVIADGPTRRLLGVQIVGGRSAGKRIDTAAAALWGEMTVDDLAEMDLAYAPPFATVWEAIQLAARRLAERW